MGFIFYSTRRNRGMSTVVDEVVRILPKLQSTYTKIPNLQDLVGKDQHILSKKSNTYITATLKCTGAVLLII